MKKIIGLFFFLMLTGAGLFFGLKGSEEGSQLKEIVVYQSKTCGCCKKWIKHLEDNGFKAVSHFVDDVTETKLQMNLPMKLASCHTAVIDGYLIEGHVPVSATQKLLATRPKVKGLSVPGMPMGSPGMEGSHRETFDVISFDDKGNESVFMSF